MRDTEKTCSNALDVYALEATSEKERSGSRKIWFSGGFGGKRALMLMKARNLLDRRFCG